MAIVVKGDTLPDECVSVVNGFGIGYNELADVYLIPGGIQLLPSEQSYYEIVFLSGRNGSLINKFRSLSPSKATIKVISYNNHYVFLGLYPFSGNSDIPEGFVSGIGYAYSSGADMTKINVIDLPGELKDSCFYTVTYDKKNRNYYFGGVLPDYDGAAYVIIDEVEKKYKGCIKIKSHINITAFQPLCSNNGVLYVPSNTPGKVYNCIDKYDVHGNVFIGSIIALNTFDSYLTIHGINLDDYNNILYIIVTYKDIGNNFTEVQIYDINKGEFIGHFLLNLMLADGQRTYLDSKLKRLYLCSSENMIVVVDLNKKKIVNTIKIETNGRICYFIYCERNNSALVITDLNSPDSLLQCFIIKDINTVDSTVLS